jgi:hypothetical protein
MNTIASVFHVDFEASRDMLPAFNLSDKKIAEVQTAWKAGQYEHVADVTVDSETVKILFNDVLETVYFLTNHINSDWTKNPAVKMKTDGARSTSTDDVVKIEDKYFVCLSAGWAEISL